MPTVGCSETAGDGGSGGSAGAGGIGGDGGSAGSSGSGGAPECEGDGDCNDHNPCTQDWCSPEDGSCGYTDLADGKECAEGLCAAGQCEPIASLFPCTEQGIRDAIAAGGGPHGFLCDAPVVTEKTIVINNNVILDGLGTLTVDGNDSHRVFSVLSGPTVVLRGLVVTNGTSVGDASNGGGISNSGTLTLTNSTVSGNETTGNGGGIYNDDGTLTLTNSTVSGNEAGYGGAGIYNRGTLTLTNSTVSGNTGVYGAGGGISNVDGTLTLTNSTVSGNATAYGGSGISNDGGTLTLTNTVIDGYCKGDITSNGYNIESRFDSCGFDPGGTDQVNISAELLNLGELAANGGPTKTHKPGDGDFGDGSVAIDKIPAGDCEVDKDQRGLPRPAGTTDPKRCDVGAVEVQP